MCNFFRRAAIAAVVLALTGCHGGGVTVGGLAFPVKSSYEIVGSSYAESFQLASRAMAESDFEIYRSNREAGEIDARTGSGADLMGDNRAFRMKFTEVKFDLRETESGRIVFDIEAKSSSDSQASIDRFLATYGKYVRFTETADGRPEAAAGKRAADEVRPKAPGISVKSESEPIISEIRTQYSELPSMTAAEKPEFSRQEIVQIQTLLKKLGYDPGAVDGEMNSRTREAIERFKAENGVLMKLF
jgi:hypothetical protein